MGLCVNNLRYSYGTTEVLRGISFQLNYGEFVSILGPNGAGKSTLFRCILGLLQPSSGNVTIDSISVQTLSPAQTARRIAYIPQSHHPSFNYSVLDMVLMGTTAQIHHFRTPQRAQIANAEAALSRLGILSLRDRGFQQISGGEQQLVLIARAIAQQANVLIMDEPSASLDFGNRIHVMQTIRALTQDGYAVLQSTHDPEQAYRYSDRILAMHRGIVIADGKPQDVLRSEIIQQLYGVQVDVYSLHADSIRVCVPQKKEMYT